MKKKVFVRATVLATSLASLMLAGGANFTRR
jgi:hypothetical protein